MEIYEDNDQIDRRHAQAPLHPQPSKMGQVTGIAGSGTTGNPWIQFVKQVQAKHHCSYKEAMILASKLRKQSKK